MHLISTLIANVMTPAASLAQQSVHPVPDVHGNFSMNSASGAPEAGLIIGGEFARVMFELMTARAIVDPCGEGLIKQDGSGLRCYQDAEGAAQCSFGYDFDRQTLTPGPLAC